MQGLGHWRAELHPGRGVLHRDEGLPAACHFWMKTRDAGILQDQQLDKAKKAEILMRGLAHVGIIALVDEATGYQYERARQALEEILERFISNELRKWVKTLHKWVKTLQRYELY